MHINIGGMVHAHHGALIKECLVDLGRGARCTSQGFLDIGAGPLDERLEGTRGRGALNLHELRGRRCGTPVRHDVCW